jgi:hypothetical protein
MTGEGTMQAATIIPLSEPHQSPALDPLHLAMERTTVPLVPASPARYPGAHKR